MADIEPASALAERISSLLRDQHFEPRVTELIAERDAAHDPTCKRDLTVGCWARWRLRPLDPFLVTSINPDGYICSRNGAFQPDECERLADTEALAYTTRKLVDVTNVLGTDGDTGNLLRDLTKRLTLGDASVREPLDRRVRELTEEVAARELLISTDLSNAHELVIARDRIASLEAQLSAANSLVTQQRDRIASLETLQPYDELRRHGVSVGLAQQGLHMARAACEALGLPFGETAPIDITERIASLEAQLASAREAVERAIDVLDSVPPHSFIRDGYYDNATSSLLEARRALATPQQPSRAEPGGGSDG